MIIIMWKGENKNCGAHCSGGFVMEIRRSQRLVTSLSSLRSLTHVVCYVLYIIDY